MDIIITGGAGFIGSHLVEKFVENNYNVTVIDNLSTGRISNLNNVMNKITFIENNIIETSSYIDLIPEGCCIIHLAALADIVPSIENPQDYYLSNVTGTMHMIELARHKKAIKFIYAASSSCYGFPEIVPTPESSMIDPQYPYALTKRIGEELVLHWRKVYDLNATSLRFFNVYGPRARTTGTYGAVFGVFIAQKLANKPLTIVGDGTQLRDFTHVKDVVEAIYITSLNFDTSEVYNVGSGNPVSINYIASIIGGQTSFIPKRPGEPDITHSNSNKILTELGWKSSISIEDGINELLKNSNYWKDAPVWTVESIAKATEEWFRYLNKNEP